MEKTQCEIHSKEIDSLRERSHDNTNKITALKSQHEENEKSINKLDKSVCGIASEQVKQGRVMAVAVDNISEIKKMLSKGIWVLIAAMISIIVNTYFTFTT